MPLTNFNRDYKYGTKKEKETLPIIEKVLNIKLFPAPSKFSTFDFFTQDGKTFIELKSRKQSHDRFPTTIIGKNKIETIRDDYTYYFFYNYTDGTYYIKYDKELFKSFNDRVICRRDRNVSSVCTEIPVKLLTKVE